MQIAQRFVILLTACIAMAMATASEAMAEMPEPGLLMPLRTLKGGWVSTRQDQNGMPLPGAFKGFGTFIYPAALAVRAPDLYIADAGARKIYRYSQELQALSVVNGVAASMQTRMQVAQDQSLYVLDPARSVISRYARGGQLMQNLNSPVISAHLTEFSLTENGGQVVAVDQLNQQLVPLRPLGGADLPILSAGAGEVAAMGSVASSGRVVYTVDAGCSCVVAVDFSGQLLERIGEGELKQPRAMVVDRDGRIFVADGFDRTLKVFERGVKVAQYSAAQLQVTELTALALDQGTLYLADGPGASVAVFQIRAPGN